MPAHKKPYASGRWIYTTNYFTAILSDKEAASLQELLRNRRRLKLNLAILDDLMNLYARDRFYAPDED